MPSTRENPDRSPLVRRIHAKIHGRSRGNIPTHFRHPEKYKWSAAARFALVRTDSATVHADLLPHLLNPCGYTQIRSHPTNGHREITPGSRRLAFVLATACITSPHSQELP